MECGFTYDGIINIFLPTCFSSRWKRPIEKVTYRKKMKKRVFLPNLNKPKVIIKPPRKLKRGTDKIYCLICNKSIQRRIKAQHSRTKLHQRNLKK